ncbi:MAG: hypothetical protein SPL35_03875 [Bacteroidales bacterium]|nr:hypothetical protein [Bacteroidales bacterium]
MKIVRNILLLVLSALSVTCCSKRLGQEPSQLSIYVRIPEMTEVKAELGDVAAELSAESLIKTLSIWVFLSDYFDEARPAGHCLGYINPSNAIGRDPLTGFENRYYMNIDADIAKAHPAVDVYVIANREDASINRIAFSENTPKSVLDNYILTGNYYSINSEGTATHSSVPSSGLPFSAVGKHLQMMGNYPVMHVETLTLTRLVSKVRVVMSQLADAAGPVVNFAINDLSLDGGLIGKEEYVFNDSFDAFKLKKAGTADDYIPYRLKFSPSAYAEIAQNTAPQEYAYKSGMTAQEYETLVLKGISDGVLTDVGRYYLRESDKGLSGKIDYTIDGVNGSATFAMPDGDTFSRNHSWIVYIFFLRDEMKFTVSWTDWLDGGFFNLTQ